MATFLAAVVVLSALLVSLPVGDVDAQVAAGDAKVGATVVSDFDMGQVSVVDAANKPTVVASKLNHPAGVVALSDGSIIIAEYAGNRLVGINGQFGHELEQVVALDAPYGLAVGGDGTIYVTLAMKGEVGKIDLATRTYTKIADGLRNPGDVAVRGTVLYVAESGAGDVQEITADGKKTVVPGTAGLNAPFGVAVGPGKTLFVAAYGGNKVIKIDDDGKVSDFATIDAPVQIATEPFIPTADKPYTVIVSSRKSVMKYDQNGAAIGSVPSDHPLGVASVPTQGEAGPAATPGGPTTTRASRSRTAAPVDIESGLDAKGKVLVLCLLIILVILIAGVLFAIQRKGKGSAEAGFEERPLDAHSVTEAFGPCAPEEVELAESEGALRSIVTQREAAEKRVSDAERRVTSARERQMQAQRQRAREQLRHQGNGHGGTSNVVPFGRASAAQMNVGDLALGTDAGRQALVAFVRGEIGAQALEECWLELGEMQAVDVVRMIGGTNEVGGHASAPETKADRAELRAREDIDIAGADWEHANNEIERLKEREVATMERIAAARRALEECQYSRGYR